LKRLTIDAIKDLPNVPTKVYDIKEWNVSIELQGISKAKQIELGRIIDGEDTDAFDPVLTDEDIQELYNKDSKIIDNIFLEINTLNGIGGSATADQFQD